MRSSGMGMALATGLAIVCGIGLWVGAQAADTYVGAATCAGCHSAQAAAWKTEAHARATSDLAANKRQDTRCLGCHASDARAGVYEVQCETCHGAGGNYAKLFIMKDHELARALGLKTGDLSSCRVCHIGHGTRLVPFDAEKAWPSLPHSKTRGK